MANILSSQFMLLTVLIALQLLSRANAFSPALPATINRSPAETIIRQSGSHSVTKPLSSMRATQKPIDEDEDDEEDEVEQITREQFYRNLMGLDDDVGDDEGVSPSNGNKEDEQQQPLSPKKKGRNPKGGNNVKRPHDNRDALPFLVQVMTPPEEEPYDPQLVQQQRQTKKKLSKRERQQQSGSSSRDSIGVVGATLGEFAFEKHTSAGDKIEIDNEVYLVQRAKCQYKYAGAQKFVMVRKVLQVKPVQRAMQEDYIMRQYNAAPAPESE